MTDEGYRRLGPDEDGLNAMRGCLLAIFISSVLWLVAVMVAIAAWR